MKKGILLIAAALFLFLGNSSVAAQAQVKKNAQSIDKEKIEVTAQKKTKSLIRVLGLSDEQQKQVYSLFTKTETKMEAAKNSSDGNAKEISAKEAKMKTFIKQKMKEILNEEQYLKFLDLSESM